MLYPGNSGNFRNNNNSACGYAKKDLNGDEIEELVLLNADYTVIAIFSLKDGRPVLLQRFWDRCGGWIDKNGYVHVGGSNGADSGSKSIYKIAEGGGSLDLLFEFGTDGNEWVNDVALIKYYKIENGEKKYITEEEYNSISEQYDRYLGNRLSKEVTKEDSGLKFTQLFSETDIADENNKISEEEAERIASDHWNVKDGDVDADSGYNLYLLVNDTDDGNYRVTLTVFVERTHISTIDTIYINSKTGKIIVYDPPVGAK